MNVSVTRTRLAAVPLAIAAAFPSFSVAQTTPSLREVVVHATRFPEQAQSLPLGVSIVTADEIRASGAATVNEALMRVLGVVGRQDFYGAGDFGLDLRGFGATADNNQIVILDGQRLSEADISGSRLAVIPIESVERIEVLRGSGAVLYGEGATGGVVVITTKAGLGKDRRNQAMLQAGAGSDHLRDLRASATVAAGGFSLDVNGQKRQGDNHREHFRSDNETASVTGQWSNDWLRVGLRHSRDDLDAQLPGALSLAQFEANPRQSAPDQRSTASIDGERTGVFATALLRDWQLEADAGTRSKGVRSRFASGSADYDVDAKNHGLRARNETAFGNWRNIFVAGVDRAEWKRDAEFVFFGFPSSSRAKQTSRAWYLKDDVILPSRTRLSAGWRNERIRKDDRGTDTRVDDRQHAWELGASQPLGASVVAYARAGRSYRLPAFDEFNFPGFGAALVPQTSRDFELGARHAAEGEKLELRFFRSRLTNEIGFDPAAPDTFGFGGNVNFDPSQRQGVELDASKAVTRSLTLRLNAAVREASFRSGTYAGKDVPLVPRRTLALRADWQPLAQHRVSGGVHWVGPQYADFNNTRRIPSYATADVRYAYQWKQLEFSVAVNNLFDRKYYSQAFLRAPAYTDLYVYPEAGRTFFAAVKVSL